MSFLSTASSILAAGEPPRTEDDKTFYALGVMLGSNIKSFDLTPRELEMVKAGVAGGTLDKPVVADFQSYVPKLQQIQTARLAAAAAKEKAAGAAYLTRAAAAAGASTTRSGIVITTLQQGTGPSPTANDTVKVHYEGKFINGTVFDSSIARGMPAVFALKAVIPCWTEALQLMKVGSKTHVVCPPALAYGDDGHPPEMPGGATLVFQVQLIDIEKPGSVPAVAAK